MLTDQDLVSGGVGANVGVLAVSQDGVTTFSDESESIGKVGSANSADESRDSGERELHFECGMDLQNRLVVDLPSRTWLLYISESYNYALM